jgi:hypothetical protein
MAEMNPLARAWVEALLSGKYKQGKGCLRDAKNNFCCLGVAADVLKIDKWVFNKDENVFALKSTETWDVLPTPIWERLIEGAPNPVEQIVLADANDCDIPFEDIVNDYILPMWNDAPIDLEEHY